MANQQLNPKRLSDITERILKNSRNQEANSSDSLLFSNPDELEELINLTDGHFEADPEKSYGLYYSGIERTLKISLPKDPAIAKPVRELKCILLTGKERDKKTGIRGADSRMQKISTMEAMVDILDAWSRTSLNPMELANLLLLKNKELGYISNEKEISDYL